MAARRKKRPWSALWALFPLLSACVAPSRIVAPDVWDSEIVRWDRAIGGYLSERMPGYLPLPARVARYSRPTDVPDLPFAVRLRRGDAVAELSTGTLHLPVWRDKDALDAPRSPWRMLRHELGHHHLHHALAFRLPPALAERFGVETLPTAPAWLQEGWAAHVEDAGLENGRLAPPPINRERARDLRRRLRARRGLDPLALLTRSEEYLVGAGDYAIAWGLAHWMLRRPDGQRYLEACRRAFYAEDADAWAEFAAEFVGADGQPVEDWRMRWRDRIVRESGLEFRRMFVEPRTEKEWSAAWRSTLLEEMNLGLARDN